MALIWKMLSHEFKKLNIKFKHPSTGRFMETLIEPNNKQDEKAIKNQSKHNRSESNKEP